MKKKAHYIKLKITYLHMLLVFVRVILRSFKSGSIDIHTESVLPAVRQLAAFKKNWSKHCHSELP